VQITEITASYAMTVNLGAYENIRVEAGATATLDEGDDPAQAHADLMNHAKIAAMKAAAPLIKKRAQIDDSVWEGLPEHLKQKYANT
jgi:hypothetical protein